MIHTRIPETFSPPAFAEDDGDGIFAWLRDIDGSLAPTGASNITPGQAWEAPAPGEIAPSGAAEFIDPHWTLDSEGDLSPK